MNHTTTINGVSARQMQFFKDLGIAADPPKTARPNRGDDRHSCPKTARPTRNHHGYARPKTARPKAAIVTLTPQTTIAETVAAAPKASSLRGRLLANSVALQDAAIRRRRTALRLKARQTSPVLPIKIAR